MIFNTRPELSDWCVLHEYRGSHSHGTFIPSTDPNSIDDVDTMAVVIPPLDYYFGFNDHGFSRGTIEIKQDEWDIVAYELKKFISLLAKGNPNVLAMLWPSPSSIILNTPVGEKLITHRHLFIGKHIYDSFRGYAKDQLYKMTHCAGQGYLGAKRKGLVEKFGYDVKNASHTIRLLRMMIEFLKTGEMVVLRPDAEELMAIKTGKWTLEQVTEEATKLFARAEEALDLSELPEGIDMNAISTFAESLFLEHFHGNI